MSMQPGQPPGGDGGTAASPTFTARATSVTPVPASTPDPDSSGRPDSSGSRVRRASALAPPAPDPPAAPRLALPDKEATRALPRPAAAMDEPLISDVAGLRARWQRVQASFVDDPQSAVGDAADLIEQTAQSLVGALRQRQRQLRVMWEHGPDPAPGDGEEPARGSDTEHLRLMMQRYRALFNQLCRP